MPQLKNARHEKFAQEIVKGLPGSQAYVAAGYQTKSMDVAKVCASQLLTNPNVSARVDELRVGLAARFGVTQENIVAELAKMAFSDIRSVVKWGDGAVVKDPKTGELIAVNDVVLIGSEHLDDMASGGIAEVSQSPNGGVKVKMHDKRAALVDLGKHLGLFDGAGRDPNEFSDPLPDLSDGEALVLLERITKERILVKRKQMNLEAPTDLSKDRAAVMRHLCRNLFIAYITSIAPWFKLEAVHYEIAAHFEAVAAGELDRLMIFAPPRSGKSSMTSIFLPSWWIVLRFQPLQPFTKRETIDELSRLLRYLRGYNAVEQFRVGVHQSHSVIWTMWRVRQGRDYRPSVGFLESL